MRTRDTIIEDALGMPHEVLPRGSTIQLAQLEVLLDIRDLLTSPDVAVIRGDHVPMHKNTEEQNQLLNGREPLRGSV
jgi:hypothetical protein